MFVIDPHLCNIIKKECLFNIFLLNKNNIAMAVINATLALELAKILKNGTMK